MAMETLRLSESEHTDTVQRLTLQHTPLWFKANCSLLEGDRVSAEITAIVLAAFTEGVKAEAKRQAAIAGKALVKEVVEATPQALEDSATALNIALMGIESGAALTTQPKKRSAAAKKADKKLSAAFKEANRRYRKKDGSLRAGRTQADIARLAHKLRKKM
jgi:hypothetical protein